jgi:hypothetical protein
MMEKLVSDILCHVKLIHDDLHRFREAQLTPAHHVNSAFDIRYKVVTYTGDLPVQQLVDVQPSRVYLCVYLAATFVQQDTIYIWHPSLSPNKGGFVVGYLQPFVLTIRDNPGLVAEEWYLGSENGIGNSFGVIEIIDRRKR